MSSLSSSLALEVVRSRCVVAEESTSPSRLGSIHESTSPSRLGSIHGVQHLRCQCAQAVRILESHNSSPQITTVHNSTTDTNYPHKSVHNSYSWSLRTLHVRLLYLKSANHGNKGHCTHCAYQGTTLTSNHGQMRMNCGFRRARNNKRIKSRGDLLLAVVDRRHQPAICVI